MAPLTIELNNSQSTANSQAWHLREVGQNILLQYIKARILQENPRQQCRLQQNLFRDDGEIIQTYTSSLLHLSTPTLDLKRKEKHSKLQDEPQYATVKRTPRPPKSDVHIYHYPVHIPPELLDELQATSSQWDDDGRSSLMDTGGYIG
ncbi:uncharacterized protein TNIN_209051 [Trichonephila inaurata madagascariensis]|uniref:Uncharacterized protein n=1 Tax=Trichonephila inaurata madagascariensis TaxID=2747483 RepID=A0A8X7C2Q5_9ARAC|nr:uncharacterized protein TNIN_209051 [Trichonephila inaurata madagascariensis]